MPYFCSPRERFERDCKGKGTYHKHNLAGTQVAAAKLRFPRPDYKHFSLGVCDEGHTGR